METTKSSATKSCLIISNNGGGEGLGEVLKEMGFRSIPSNNGQEGVVAIGHYRPNLIILLFHPRDEQDVVVLRAVQALHRHQSFLVVTVIISSDEKTVKHLLGVKKNRRGIKILTELAPKASLKRAIGALLRSNRRRSKKTAQAVSA